MKKGKGKSGARRTHYAIWQSGLTDNGKQLQANSIGVNTKHFFSCESIAAGQLTDIVAGVVLDADGLDPGAAATLVNQVVDTGAANTITMQQWANKTLASGSWHAFGADDVILVVANRATKDPAKAAESAGSCSFYIGDGSGNAILRVQPYLGGWISIAESGNDTRTTESASILASSREGEDHIYAVVKRTASYVLEHWADGVMTDSKDFSGESATWKTAWDNWSPSNEWACGHSAFGVPFGANHIEYPQDYYGIAVCSFANGAPTDLSEALPWMLTEWVAGNKVMYPGWVSLT